IRDATVTGVQTCALPILRMRSDRTNPASDLAGQRVIITGGSGGIGREVGRLLLSEGCKVALVARNCESLDAVRTELEATAPGDRSEERRGGNVCERA